MAGAVMTGMGMSMQTLRAQLVYGLHRHGLLAVVGLGLIVGAVGLHVFGVLQAQADTVALNAQAAKLRLLNLKPPNSQESASRRLEAFYDELPVAAGALESVDLIHRSAGTHDVKLATGEYRLQRDGASALQRYQITLPAKATYPSLRLWLADVMNAVPAAALDEITIRRDDVASPTVDARVRLTLYVRAQ